MYNIRIWMKYDGTDFHGYQIQKNGFTVQQALTEALSKLTGESISVTGCSRTDAGVHAAVYAANFFSNTKIPPEKLPFALNAQLPKSIRVTGAEYVDNDFHATFSAKEKTYEYTMDIGKIADPFLLRYAWHFPYELDMKKMQEAAEFLVGKHDFSAFCAAGAQTKTSVRTVKALKVTSENSLVKVKITADGFLYNMVRIIVGTLAYVAIGRIKVDEMEDIILSCDRRRAGITAPPQGLKLVDVVY